MGGIKPGVSRSENSTVSQAVRAGALSCMQEDVKVKLSPQVCESDRLGIFLGSVKTLTGCHQ